MHVTGRLMIASVGSTIVGSARSSNRTSRAPYNTAPCISHLSSLSEGLRPSDSPTRSLASRFAGSLRSRGSRRYARSRRPSTWPGLLCTGVASAPFVLRVGDVFQPIHGLAIELLLHGDVRHRRGW